MLLLGPLLLLSSAEAQAISHINGGLLALLEGHASAAVSQRAHGLLATLAAALAQARRAPGLAGQLRCWLDASGAFGLLAAEAEPALPLDQAQRAACRSQIERALHYLDDLQATAERLREPLDPAALPQLLDEALVLAHSEPAGAETDAVAIWSPDDLYGRHAAVVFLAGMDESALPAREPALQPVSEQQLNAACAHLPGFVPPQRQDPAALLARARRQLTLALSRAGDRVVLSYSRTSLDGTLVLPSPLFLELLGPQAIAGEQLQLPDVEAADSAALVTLRRGLGPSNPLLSLAPAALAGASPAALLPHLELPGTSGAGASLSTPATAVGDAGFRASATAVRDFLACPRRYFYARLLQLGEEEGERLALGQLFHATLERLFDEWDALAPNQRLRRGLATLQQLWISFAHRLGPPLHQASYRRLVRRGLADLIDHEARLLRPTGRRPVARERRFRLSWRDGTMITGVLDRVDRLPDGRYAVIDYKTGSSSPSLRELVQQFLPIAAEQGWRLSDVQLPIYAYALESGAVEGLPAGEVAEVSLLYPFKLRAASGGFSREGWRRIQLVAQGELRIDRSAGVAVVPRAALERTWRELDVALGGMRGGPFPAQPREQRVCRSCPYRFTCPQPLGDDEESQV